MHVYPASGEESSENRGWKPVNANEELGQETSIAPLIHCIRGFRVILDTDLAQLYRVETRALNQAVRRNREKFPPDLLFELDREEIGGISQTVTSLVKLKFSKQVHAFTEHGALQAANILNSPRAAAIKVGGAASPSAQKLAANAAILKRLPEIDKTLLIHDDALRDIYQKLRPLLEPPPPEPKPQIGFHVKENAVPYRTRLPERSAKRTRLSQAT
jgi:hypothetical protein